MSGSVALPLLSNMDEPDGFTRAIEQFLAAK
jgi:hypothetical protein